MLNIRHNTLVAFAALCVVQLYAVPAFSQAMPLAVDPDKLLADQISSKDADVRQQAIDAIRKRAAEHPEAIAAPLRRYWLTAMARAGFNDDIVQMTQTALFSGPGSQLVIEPMLRGRIYALIALGRKDEALADARRYYNVCTLDQTGRAVDLLVAAMEAKYGDAAEARIRQFRMRQMTASGATEEPTLVQPTTEQAADGADADDIQNSNAPDQMILSITVDGTQYMTEAAKWKNNRRQLFAYGNLLLMAGHADEAYLYFTDLLNKARTDKALAADLERQSAAMRAQDGNLARAQGRLRHLQGDGL